MKHQAAEKPTIQSSEKTIQAAVGYHDYSQFGDPLAEREGYFERVRMLTHLGLPSLILLDESFPESVCVNGAGAAVGEVRIALNRFSRLERALTRPP